MKVNFHFVQVVDCRLLVVHDRVLRHVPILIVARPIVRIQDALALLHLGHVLDARVWC